MAMDLEKYILNKIYSDEWTANTRLPTEAKMIEISGLSKMSIRKVIEKLREREIIYSIQGNGIFVSPFSKDVKIRKFSDYLKATKVTYLPSSTKIPKSLINRFNKNLKIKPSDLITFVKLYFVDEEIVAYTLNWLINKDGKYSLNQIINGNGKVFQNADFNRVISTHRLEKTTPTDKNILLIDHDLIPTNYSYYIKKDHDIIMIRLAKTKPKYYKSFEIKNKY